MSEKLPETFEQLDTEIDHRTTEPPMYRVLLHNDEFTTKVFVVEVLMTVFNKSMEAAARIMWQAHHGGTGLCGVYALEVAETKVKIAGAMAREAGFPLRLTLEEDA